MALGEFELIRSFFSPPSRRPDVVLTVGDDCALLTPASGQLLATTVDTLVEGVHFLSGTDPRRLGHKALAVNLSDLAAMGARPAWVTLALTLPGADEAWLTAFSKGFLELADRHGVELVGGDTTRGPLSITVQAMGFVGRDKAMRRSGAGIGDGIYLTGELGLAGLGLDIALGRTPLRSDAATDKLERPEPRIRAGLVLAGLASACIDVSDGLAADLGHILKASGVGATLDWQALPLPHEVKRHCEDLGDVTFPLRAGDDYELCFTLPEARESDLAALLPEFGCACTRIGRIERESGLRMALNGEIRALNAAAGYQHFSS